MNRRRFARKQIEAVAALRWAGGQTITGGISDVSLNGLSVQSKESLPEGTEVQVFLSASEGISSASVEFHGVVVRSEEGHVAVHIETLDPSAFLQWRALVELATAISQDIETGCGVR